MLRMLLIEHQVLFPIKDCNLTILESMSSLGDIFADKEFLENGNFPFQCGQFLHQRCDFPFRNTFFEFEVEPMDKRSFGSLGSIGFSHVTQGRQTT